MNNISFEALQKTIEEIKQKPELAKRKWSTHISWQDGVQNQVTAREFPSFMVDEPEVLGGTDKAPNPIEYLIGAAGSCFAITFEVFASQNEISLEKVEVEIEADLNVAVFLGLEEGNGGIIDPVIRLKAITDSPKEKIVEIAKAALANSPVLDSLQKDVELIIK